MKIQEIFIERIANQVNNRMRMQDSREIFPVFVTNMTFINQRTNGPVNDHLISGPTVSTNTSFANFDIVLKWVKVNSGSSFI